MSDTLIRGARVVPITSDPFTGDVLLRNGVIAALGQNLDSGNAVVVDAKDQRVLPGFIDAHAHCGIWEESLGWAGDDVNEVSAAVTAGVRALDAVNPRDVAFRDALTGGVTAVNVLPGSGNVIGGLAFAMSTAGTLIDDMVLRAPTGLKSALGENPKRLHGRDRDEAPKTRLGTARIIRETIHSAIHYRERQGRGECVAPDLDAEHIGLVLDGIIPWRQHCHRADDIATAFRLADEFGYDLVLDHGTEAHLLAEEVARRGVPVLLGPVIVSRLKAELSERTPAAAGILHRAGVQVSIITDHPVVPIEHLTTQVALCVKHGLPREAALETITINPARALGVADRVGSLEVGKRADVVL